MKCKECKVEIEYYFHLARLCIPCAMKIAKEKERKKFDKRFNLETRRLEKKFTGKSHEKELTIKACNRYIRAKERYHYLKQGKQPECISCGTTNPNTVMSAGHLKTAGGYPELRFNEKNIFYQCLKNCNKELSGNINGTKTTYGFKKGILKRLGEVEGKKRLEYLESYHEPKHYKSDDFERMKKDFNAKANALEKLIEEIKI